MARKFNSKDFEPTPLESKYSKEELLSLLSKKKTKKFCWHNWVYWKFGLATKLHRVCKKCYKKQQDRQIIPKFRSTWIKEINYD